MKCEDVLGKMTAYVDGELPAEETNQIASHITSCPCCQNALKEMLAIAKAMPLLEEVEPPAGLRSQIMKQVRAEAEKKQSHTVWDSFKSHWYPLRAAAAMFILCLTLVYNIYPMMLMPQQEGADHGEQLDIMSEAPLPADSELHLTTEGSDDLRVASEEGLIGSWLQQEHGRPKRIVVTLIGGSLAGVFALKSRRKAMYGN